MFVKIDLSAYEYKHNALMLQGKQSQHTLYELTYLIHCMLSVCSEEFMDLRNEYAFMLIQLSMNSFVCSLCLPFGCEWQKEKKVHENVTTLH